jgi:hypothetical protein
MNIVIWSLKIYFSSNNSFLISNLTKPISRKTVTSFRSKDRINLKSTQKKAISYENG